MFPQRVAFLLAYPPIPFMDPFVLRALPISSSLTWSS
jgi:hypothetical protein